MSAAAGRTAVYELKKALRKAAKAKLSALTPEMKSVGSAAVTASLCARPEFAAASSVAVYLSMPDEVDTAAIISEIFKSGKRCFVPRFEGNTMDMWTVDSEADIASLPRGKWNIAQPEHDLDTRASALGGDIPIDLVLVPGLAFSVDGGRLGRGKGFYDGFLTQLIARADELGRARPATIGIAFSAQQFDEVPTNEFDVPLDAVVFSG